MPFPEWEHFKMENIWQFHIQISQMSPIENSTEFSKQYTVIVGSNIIVIVSSNKFNHSMHDKWSE